MQGQRTVKAKFSTGKGSAQGSVRYAVHRENETGEAQFRMIFDKLENSVDKEEAFKRFEEDKSRYTYTIILNPGEKDARGIDMQQMTREVMSSLQDKGVKNWVAVEHKDHTEYAHVHVIAKTGAKLTPQDFEKMRKDQHASIEKQAEPLRDTWKDAGQFRQAQRDQEQGR